jgi:hypothetical protein
MRAAPLVIFFLTLPCMLSAQTNISGIVNSYYRVTELIPSKSCVRVDNITGLHYNDMVMIIQMKGAAVNTANASTFGSVSNLNNAANYEIGTVCSIRGDSVFLFKQLFRNYTVSGKVQLVRIPKYASAVVTDSLKPAPWDSAAGKGGVLALSVSDNLVLNAPVWAGSAGYRGGAYVTSNATCYNFLAPNDYYYNATSLAPQDGACKGESVSDLSLAFSGGKGAVANGGGGGNNHNNGGGGGSNITAGGQGGGNSSASGCTVANPGKGGYALVNDNGSKIFMGGGGGAGHANSGFSSTGGGRGGGIVFIHANTLYSNGNEITASGQKGGSTIGDGASGGGGGGTVILDINSYADAVSIRATGGDGGDEDDDNSSQKCYGEGGGGSGGAVYFKTAVPGGTISVTGGLKGNKIRSLNCGTLVSGAAGLAGSIAPNYSFTQSASLSTYCGATVLTVSLIFKVLPLAGMADIEWEVSEAGAARRFIVERKNDGEAWKQIGTVPGSMQTRSYAYRDKDLKPGAYAYRLKIVEMNGNAEYSLVRTVTVSDGGNRMTIFPNPASEEVTIMNAFHPEEDMRIFDELGKLVFRKKIASNEMILKQNISFLKKGIYLIVIGRQAATLAKQ